MRMLVQCDAAATGFCCCLAGEWFRQFEGKGKDALGVMDERGVVFPRGHSFCTLCRLCCPFLVVQ